METFQNISKSPGVTYQLFIRKTQIRANNYKKVGCPIYVSKMNLQQSPRLNCQLKSQINGDKKYKLRSNSLKYDYNNTYRQTYNKCIINQQQINQVPEKRRVESMEESIYYGQQYKHYTQPQKEFNIVLPQQLLQKQKQKQKQKPKIVETQAITEPSLIEALQPWESYNNSLAYYQ
ncbi:unnamed protein product (macronuclear) [Paramecium tetraurelia]|uniref:Uncharacterized protein n=1 Tax=Paramecium tetraurelia TaxID=5888 RepID=A0CWD8_PARTE|nr:uncharacterized protein GSPATT00001307001 [Paramecium tetraurelia]CAK75105.1 unnamed protein product [Paramecium tetraurelia]|eukprot:XP_001442502.1 hypothetical protein (macronuclear) [Paramecium tetraurelia strain d4-2]